MAIVVLKNTPAAVALLCLMLALLVDGCGTGRPQSVVVAAPPGGKALARPPEITSETEEGFADFVFHLEDLKTLEGGKQRVRAKGLHKGVPVGFAIELDGAWRGSGATKDVPIAVNFGKLRLLSIGKESDALMRVMAQLYATKAKPQRMRDSTELTAACLQGDPAHLEKGPASIKLFHESDKEDENAEFFVNIDTRAERVELREKDPEYREAVIHALAPSGKGSNSKAGTAGDESRG